jgi:predicted ATPase/DNA-binding SARP family transcriptional activator
VEFGILGPVRIVAGDRTLTGGSGQRRAVLAVLIIHAPAPVSVDRLIDELWGEQPSATAKHAVAVHVSALRKLLRDAGAGDEVALRTSRAGYALEVDPQRIDARRFERLLDESQQVSGEDPPLARRLLDEALSLWRGPALADLRDSDIATDEKERLDELRSLAIERRAEARIACGEHAEAIAAIAGLVAANPVRERPRRLLMRALYRSGRHAEALAAYREACVALHEIGLQPGPELRELEAAILRHDPSLRPAVGPPALPPEAPRAEIEASESPQLRSLNRSNLPVPPGPIVGRRGETIAALELLASPEVRLVTLIGPGGSGKTRLAMEVGREAITRYPDGVWMVLLASIRDGSLLAGEIARVLDIEPVAGERAEQTLVASLAERELLLVLDNTEHLPRTGALVAELLAAAPRVKVLCTSREPLRIRAEQRMDVGPLRREDASELFLTRARAVRPDLNVDDEDREAVDRICARLDCLPLALELAAARIAAFKPAALEARLAARLSLPAAVRDLPARQQTLRATIEWSYRLLSAQEREMLESLAPFIGGVRLDAAESIWGSEALDLVLSLAEKSLLRRREDSDGETRLWTLETVREFASEQSAEHTTADANADRHAAYFRELAAEAAPFLTTSDQARWLDRLDDEQANLRAAMDRLMLLAPQRALAMAASQIWFWETRGYMHESLGRLSAALESTHGDSGDRAVALFGAGRMAAHLGDASAAERLLAESARLARAVGNKGLAALALSNLVWAYQLLGDERRGAAETQEAAALARSSGNQGVLSTVLNNEGDMRAARGEFERARPLLEESLAIRRGIGDPRLLAISAANLAPIQLGAGELDAAEALLAEGLAHASAIAHGPLILSLLSTVALAALRRNDPAGAQDGLAAASEKISPDVDAESAAIFLSAAAALAATKKDPLVSATLWAATDAALHDAVRVEVPPAAALRAELLPHARAAACDAWNDAWSAGAKLTLHAALEYAARAITGSAGAADALT